MSEEFAQKCAIFGNVHMSVHAPENLDHVCAAARTYRKATKKKPGLNVLLTSKTLPHLVDIVDQAKRAGVRKVLFLRYKDTAKNHDVRDMHLGKELEELPGLLKSLQWRHKSMMFLYDCSLFELLAQQGLLNVKASSRNDDRGCQGGNACLAIDVEGGYRPCSFWHESFGSVLDLSYDSWMHNPKLVEFRNMRRSESCAQCQYMELCAGGCRLLYERASTAQ